ncbi:MAG: alanine--tRNA ligase [Clostridiales bacterium]|nr:alanine--tRNA ligase [Clostridiales bacterium]
MQWTGLNELREKYLSFFESKGHLRLPSFPLIPQNDKSLLLINSGMAPMKKYFTGEITPPRKRVTTCQKCIRTPDIERVGKTARHGTYFEMLGNFSFGDYFKHEATAWAWEFCTKVLELPVDRIWVSIYQDDDQAFDIWTKEVGVSPDRIVRLGKEDNFWEHGTGPCGPCSELYFDRGEQYGCGSPTCGVGCDCDRYVEFWNLVFTQFDSDGHDNYTPLDHPNIDTGMGLERLACIMQGVGNLFEVDTVQNIMKHVSRIAGVTYGEDEKVDVSLRVITDHIRSTTFMVGDGVMPSNEGRGYVLRRLLRRAARHGRLLGIEGPFLSDVCDTVIKENENAYPELAEKRDFIKKLIHTEEESFGKTIDQGLAILSGMLDELDARMLSGEDAFKLYDTFGFPIDLTREILAERGLDVDEEQFNALMLQQRELARSSRKAATAEAWAGSKSILEEMQATEFKGYETLSTDSKVLAIVSGGEMVEELAEGDEAVVVLDATPFYGESGGQVGDTGVIKNSDAQFEVTDTTRTHNGVFLHKGTVKAGSLRVGDRVSAQVVESERRAIMRNHTAAHLLQAALREVLGTHVQQAGQLVSAKSVRFDFTHFEAMTAGEIEKVETLVNDIILQGMEVATREMPIAEAKKLGAMALFGEKYGDVVRVVSAGDYSTELCGGTHVDNTAKLGLFKIVSEGSVAAGVRRIEGVTGAGVLDYLNSRTALLSESAEALKVGNVEELPRRALQVMVDLKAKEKEINALNERAARMQIEGLFSGAKQVDGITILSVSLSGTGSDALRTMTDQMKQNRPNLIAVIAGINGDKATLAAVCGSEAVKRGAHAGNLVRAVAQITGGNGGGRPDSAMAGAKDLTKIDEALMAVEEIAAGMLKK